MVGFIHMGHEFVRWHLGRKRCVTVLDVVKIVWFCTVVVVAVSFSAQISGGPFSEVTVDPDSALTINRSPDLDEVIRRVSERQRSLRTLRARFKQTKKNPMLLSEESSVGEFAFRSPDAVRWDYSAPDPMVVLILDDIVVTYLPDFETMKRSKVPKRYQQLLGMFASSQQTDEFYKQFKATLTDVGAPHPFRITMRPNESRLRKTVSMVEVYIDRELFLPVKIEYHEKIDTVTSFELIDIKVDPVIKEDYFQFDPDRPFPPELTDELIVGG